MYHAHGRSGGYLQLNKIAVILRTISARGCFQRPFSVLFQDSDSVLFQDNDSQSTNNQSLKYINCVELRARLARLCRSCMQHIRYSACPLVWRKPEVPGSIPDDREVNSSPCCVDLAMWIKHAPLYSKIRSCSNKLVWQLPIGARKCWRGHLFLGNASTAIFFVWA